MAIVKNVIKAEIKQAFIAVMNETSDDRAAAIDRVADKIADAVVNAIKSATITYTSGLIAPPTGGAVTGVFLGELK